MPDHAAIEIRNLSKSYGTIRAVQDLTLDVAEGEMFGFLGPNGAGKTTTIRILLDLVRPSGGHARILGKDCRRRGLEVRGHVGYLPGEPGLYTDMTGAEALDLFGRMQGSESDPSVRASLLDRFRLGTSDLRRKIRDYSTGMRRKLGLVQAFQADPPLLILDEPTEGLDPLMQEAVYSLLGELRKRGRTIFLCSHVLSEVDRLCDRVGLVREGSLVLLASVEEIRRMAPRRVRVVFDAPVSRGPTPSAAYHVLSVSPREWCLAVPGAMGELLREVAPLPVVDLEIEKPGLEDVLPRFYREGKA